MLASDNQRLSFQVMLTRDSNLGWRAGRILMICLNILIVMHVYFLLLVGRQHINFAGRAGGALTCLKILVVMRLSGCCLAASHLPRWFWKPLSLTLNPCVPASQVLCRGTSHRIPSTFSGAHSFGEPRRARPRLSCCVTHGSSIGGDKNRRIKWKPTSENGFSGESLKWKCRSKSYNP